jgi:hypothetical protein
MGSTNHFSTLGMDSDFMEGIYGCKTIDLFLEYMKEQNQF